MIRADGRSCGESRPVEITTGFIKYAEGSALIRCGDTVVLCTASVEERVPPHVKPGCGWVTAEYSMLPSANLLKSGVMVTSRNSLYFLPSALVTDLTSPFVIFPLRTGLR